MFGYVRAIEWQLEEGGRRKSYIKCSNAHSCIYLVGPCFLDILCVLGATLFEIMVESYLFGHDLLNFIFQKANSRSASRPHHHVRV
jgi:hypothetical protein